MLKTLLLTLTLLIFSVTGLRAEEISLKQFTNKFITALQTKDADKIGQLLTDNPNTAKKLQEMLTNAGKGTGEQAEQARALAELLEKLFANSRRSYPELDRLQEEAKKAYYLSDYSTALKKGEAGLKKAREMDDKGYISQFLGNLGVVYNDLGQYRKALVYLKQALQIRREIGDRRGEGDDLNNLGVVYDYLGQYQKALEYYQQALTIHREIGDRRRESANLSNLGVVYQILGQNQKALNYSQQALTIHREIGDRRGEGVDLTNLGVVYNGLGQYQKALEYLKQALQIKREIGNRREESADLSNLGNVYQNLGQYQKALEHLKQALQINREIGNRREESADLTNLGVMYSKLSQYQKALEYLKQALQIKQEIGNRRGVGNNLTNLGNVYQYLGQYQKALWFYQQALSTHQEISDRRGVGNNLTNLGVVYHDLGQYQKALEYLTQALQIRREIGDRRGEGDDLTNLGNVYKNLGQYQKALEYLKQALQISLEIGDKHGEGANFTNLGNVYRKLGQYQKALEYYQQALTIDREIGDRRGEGADLTNLGNVYQNLGQYQKAKEAFQGSMSILETIRSGDLWIVQRGLAFAEAKLKQPELAIQHYEQALDHIEKLRVGITTKEHQTSFMQNKLFVYDELIVLLQSLHSKHPDKHYDRKAIETFERKQGRIFLEEMGESGARRFVGLPDDIKQQEQALALQWQAKSRSPQQWQALEQKQAQFENMLAQKYPKYHALKYPQPVDLATLQNQVLQQNEMLLVYAVLTGDEDIESQTILWIIGKKQFQMFTLLLDENTLAQEVAQFREFIVSDGWVVGFLEASQNLYQKLLPKAARELLVGAEVLYIVPTGVLYGVPFEVLLNTPSPEQDMPRYLIEDYAIAYLSSASLLKTLREAKRQAEPPKPFLAFADPVYPPCPKTQAQKSLLAQDDSVTGLRTKSYLKLMKQGCFPPLEETADEVQQIADILKADKDKALYLREQASRSTVFALNEQQQLDEYRYIMFSVHGVLPGEVNQITQPALVLSNPITEGYLTMADAFGLKLNADFVNLSACNSH